MKQMSKGHTCPHCGAILKIEIKRGSQPKFSRQAANLLESRQNFNNAIALPKPEPQVSFRETPAWLPTKESHVTVPLQQAIITGVLWSPVWGFAVGATCYTLARFTVGGSLLFGLIGMFGGFWIVVVMQWSSRLNGYNSLLWKVEELMGIDINRDGDVGEPQPQEPQTVRVEMRHDSPDGQRWQFADLRVSPKTLQRLAGSILRGDTFSERVAMDAGLTRDEFIDLRDTFIDRGWAQWNHPTHRQMGASLRRGGLFVIRQIAQSPLPHDYASYEIAGIDSTQQHAAEKWEFIES